MTDPMGRRMMVPGATLVLLVLGTVALTLALTLALTDRDATSPAQEPAPSTTGAPQVPVLSGDVDAPTADILDTPVSELADPDWVAATSRASNIPARALAAYAGASVAASEAYPACRLGWNTLAAIGHVESEHGTLGGTQIDDAGDTGSPIIGVPLDGDGVARIPDTDNGRLDGDSTWDRAVGPLQFIPSTWQAHAADGNGDGTTDVHNIDDAARAAADHLCSFGGDLTVSENWIAAIAAYNLGADYNRRVAEAATRYAEVVTGDR